MMRLLCMTILTALIAAPAAAQSEIRRVDFRNFAYQPSCTDMEDGKALETLTVKNGEFTRERMVDGFPDRLFFAATAVTYGDLTGDGQEEAVVMTGCNTGGTGQFTEGLIYGMKAGKPVLLARVPGGDRADGGLRSLTVESGVLVIDANSGGLGACCPEFATLSRVRLKGDTLVEISAPVRRELYPKQRLAFARGTSSALVEVTIAPWDRKRYAVGARQGQTLTVLINAGTASISLLGDTDTKDEPGRLTATLPKTGDYTIELTNESDAPARIRATVSIR